MKFTVLSNHLHTLRKSSAGRSIGYRMTASEVWSGAIESIHNNVQNIVVREWPLPPGALGFFTRLSPKSGSGDLVEVYYNQNLPEHWQEFVIIKELMHCWSPQNTRINNPAVAQALISGMIGPAAQLTSYVLADQCAVLAAAEVMLPHFIIEPEIAANTDFGECAFRHNLHPEIAALLYAPGSLTVRKQGSL